VRDSFKEFDEPGKSIVGNAALAAEVVVVGGNEAAERQTALWTVL